MNERRLFLPLRSAVLRALAAIFVLHAHAAKKVNSQVGLNLHFRGSQHECLLRFWQRRFLRPKLISCLAVARKTAFRPRSNVSIFSQRRMSRCKTTNAMNYLRFIRTNWLLLTAGFLLTFSSSYGQTYIVSLFAGQIKADFGLTDGEWGGVYTLSTLLSAAAMVWAGTLMDRFRVRTLSLIIMVVLALTCLGMSLVTSWVTLIFITFLLRFTGQGMLTQLGTVAMMRWFEQSRGKALALASTGFAVGQALLPVVFVALFAVFDWRLLWVLAAVLTVMTVPLLWMTLKRERTPQSIAQDTEVAGMYGRHWTRPEMLRSGFFFLMIPTIIGPSAWGAALFFQQVHLVEVKGWSLVEYVALMPIFTVSSIASTFASGWAIDRLGVSRVVPFQMLPDAAAFAILAYADTIWMAGVGLLVFGLGQGLQGTCIATIWPEYFGTRHIGAIKAAVAALMVFGTAVGPGVTGVLIDLGYNFPDQMLPIAGFYLLAGALATLGIQRYRSKIGVVVLN